MATTIKLKNGSGAPLAGDLVQGEPALDLTNKRLYTEDSGGTVIEVGTNPTSLTTGTFTSTGIDDNATSTAITIDASQRVGIGDTNPVLGKLVISDTSPFVVAKSTSTSGAGYVMFVNNGSNGVGVIATDDGGHMTFDTGSTGAGQAERMRIDSSGNVGIGTSSPDGKLNVFSASAGSVSADADADELVLENSGNVGLSLLTASTGESGIYFGNPGTNGQKDFYLKYYHESHATTANRRAFTFNTASTERMRIDSNGTVGVGVTPATDWGDDGIQIGAKGTLSGGSSYAGFAFNCYPTSNGWSSKYTTTDEASLYLQGAGLHLWYNAASGTAGTSVTFQERMRIDSSGNLLVGTTSANALITADNASNTGNTLLSLKDSGGTGTHTQISFNNTNGQVGTINTSGTATSYNTSSDQRLKENIVDAPAGNIDAIRVRSFDWKADGTHQTYGVIAQELVDVAPEAVSQGETEDDIWSVDYSKLVPMMIKEIQDLKAKVTELEAK